jgi:hypothetical protein
MSDALAAPSRAAAGRRGTLERRSLQLDVVAVGSSSREIRAAVLGEKQLVHEPTKARVEVNAPTLDGADIDEVANCSFEERAQLGAEAYPRDGTRRLVRPPFGGL